MIMKRKLKGTAMLTIAVKRGSYQSNLWKSQWLNCGVEFGIYKETNSSINLSLDPNLNSSFSFFSLYLFTLQSISNTSSSQQEI